MLARVVEILLDTYRVKCLENIEEMFVKPRGNVKRHGTIKVGDIVNIEKIDNEHVINNIEKRKNEYIRPPVANIDYIFIVIAAGNPKPDYLLLDKQLIMAKLNNTIPIIIVNKTDLEGSEEIIKYVTDTYSKLGYLVITTNTINNKLINEELFRNIESGKLCAFSGNSGVGKSSIISNIKKDGEKIDTNSVSIKTNKGRHTTKSVTLYEVLNNENKVIYFLDTPGFSSYEIFNIKAKELKEFFTEFNNVKCEYDDCNHIKEDIKYCKIKKLVQNSEIDKQRYEHYIKLYEELSEKEKRMYK